MTSPLGGRCVGPCLGGYAVRRVGYLCPFFGPAGFLHGEPPLTCGSTDAPRLAAQQAAWYNTGSPEGRRMLARSRYWVTGKAEYPASKRMGSLCHRHNKSRPLTRESGFHVPRRPLPRSSAAWRPAWLEAFPLASPSERPRPVPSEGTPPPSHCCLFPQAGLPRRCAGAA